MQVMPEVSNQNSKIRVFIVDDSAVIRRMIANTMQKFSDIEVVGTAANGLLAVNFLKANVVDVVTLDVEMPEMDGIAALKEIRKFAPDLPIIMFSSLTQRGTDSTIQALINGASDYVSKPTGTADVNEACKVLEETLIPKMRSLVTRGKRVPKALSVVNAQSPNVSDISHISGIADDISALRPKSLGGKIEAICIGVSTGGPAALMYLFEAIKEPLPLPIFIVQHMPPKFTEILANRLTDVGVIPVEEPYEGQEVKAGRAYIAPGGRHMALERQGSKVIMTLNDDPPENSCRPAADVLFRSASQIYGSKLLAVVLTGMGSDGLNGALEVIGNHGCVIAQDERSSVVWGMPGAVVKANLVEGTFALNEMPAELIRRALIK